MIAAGFSYQDEGIVFEIKRQFQLIGFARIGFWKKTEPYPILIKSIGLSQTVFYKMGWFVFQNSSFFGFGSVQFSIAHTYV